MKMMGRVGPSSRVELDWIRVELTHSGRVWTRVEVDLLDSGRGEARVGVRLESRCHLESQVELSWFPDSSRSLKVFVLVI